MLQAYFHSGITLNTMRSLLSSGFADLHNPRSWRLGHVRSPALHQAFETVVDRLEDALDFMRVVGADPTPSSSSSSSSNQAGLASTLQVSERPRKRGVSRDKERLTNCCK